MERSEQDRNIVDLESFKKADASFDMKIASPISWKDTLALREYEEDGQKFTMILYKNGTTHVTDRRMNSIITKLCNRVKVFRKDMVNSYNFLEMQGPYPCVAGKYNLFSTLGASNADTAWLAGHHIKGIDRCKLDGHVYVLYDNDILVRIDASLASVKRNWHNAIQIGELQIKRDRYYDIRHGDLDVYKKKYGLYGTDCIQGSGKSYTVEEYEEFEIKEDIKRDYEASFNTKPSESEVMRIYNARTQIFGAK